MFAPRSSYAAYPSVMIVPDQPSRASATTRRTRVSSYWNMKMGTFPSMLANSHIYDLLVGFRLGSLRTRGLVYVQGVAGEEPLPHEGVYHAKPALVCPDDPSGDALAGEVEVPVSCKSSTMR
jgi:hypothetical protein